MRKAFEIGGIMAAVVLIGFGVASIVLGANGGNTVRNNLAEQKIVGTPDMTPAGITAEAKKAHLDTSKIPIPSCSVAGKAVDSGSSARCFAQYMTIHALEATGGLYYSQMPRYATANGEGTNEEAKALKSAEGHPGGQPGEGSVDSGDRSGDRPEHELHGKPDLAVRDRRRYRPAAQRLRVRDPRDRWRSA